MTNFFIADMHFGHKNIIDYENRPFHNVSEMDKEIIKRWNTVIKKEDTVFVLGDVCFYNQERTKEIVGELNGYLILIMGNHDRARSRKWWLDVGFDEVSKYPIIFEGFYLLSHEPLYMNENMPYVNIHGHIHGQKYESKQYVNVGVEHWNYTPASFDMIKDYIGINK